MKINSAYRLIEILENATQYNTDQKIIISDVWTTVFDLQDNDVGKLLKYFSALIDLTRKVKNDVENIEGVNTDLLLKPFIRIEKALSLANFRAQWSHIATLLNSETIYGLKLCAEFLAKEGYQPISSIKPEKQEDLLTQVSLLIEKVKKSELSEDLKMVITLNLQSIYEILEGIQVYGLEKLIYVLEKNIGAIWFHWDEYKSQKEDPVVKEYNRYFISLIQFINSSAGIKMIPEPKNSEFPLLEDGNKSSN